MTVTKTEEVFDKNLLDKIGKWDPKERRANCRKRTVYAGWAIFTPEDNMLVFLKEADSRKNLYQFTLAADWYAPRTVAERLFLLKHNYPVRIGEHEPRRGANSPCDPARDTDEYRRIQESRLMAAPEFTVDNLADYAAAYRARIEKRRISIESRPREKRFVLTEPPSESKEFIRLWSTWLLLSRTT